MKKMLIIGFIVSLSSPLMAQTYSTRYRNCIDKAMATSEMLNCAQQEIDLQDKKLNANYQLLMAELTGARKNLIRDAQRAWIKQRDADCGFQGMQGGTIASVQMAGCILSKTATRANELAEMME